MISPTKERKIEKLKSPRQENTEIINLNKQVAELTEQNEKLNTIVVDNKLQIEGLNQSVQQVKGDSLAFAFYY